MKKGSNFLLMMIGVYIVIAGVVVLLFVPGFFPGATGKAADSEFEEPEFVATRQEARVIGDASSDAPVDDSWKYTDGTVTDADLTPTPTPEPESGKKTCYRFRMANVYSWLRVREAPDMNAETLGRMSPGTEGYILEKGTEWSKLVTDDGELIGYSSNDYLEFVEVKASEIPNSVLKMMR
ncbi:MAG: SH3 domain-containing protein [Lachnospiraceae bacterium]|nr:SH3 domain-containing protein [Lachnospiraceae bacterium]